MSSRSGLASVIPLIFSTVVTAASLGPALLRRDVSPVATSTTLNFTNVADPFNFDVVNLSGDNQVIYTANITIDGASYEVQLDTGSSDLWINTQGITLSPQANDTGISVNIPYGDGTVASGDVFMAATQFGNWSIPSQAFINAPGSNATSDNDLGLLGLSARNISQIYLALASNTPLNGNPLMYNVFSAYPNVSNHMTFLLSRSELGITDGGIFTIGDVDPNWSSILNQKQIPVVSALQQWIGITDGIIVNGKNITGHGLLSSAKNITKEMKSKTLSLLDSGTSLGVLPQHYWDAIYKDVPGLKALDKSQGVYTLPCETRLNVSVVFHGTEYAVNPLDLTQVTYTGDFADGSNKTVCITTFQAQDLSSQFLDVILGDAFMRNVYALFNFGNWTTAGEQPPYLQLLSTTNQSEAWAQFEDLNNARIAQWNALGGQYNPTNSTSNGSTNTVTKKRASVKSVPVTPLPNVNIVEEVARTYRYWTGQ